MSQCDTLAMFVKLPCGNARLPLEMRGLIQTLDYECLNARTSCFHAASSPPSWRNPERGKSGTHQSIAMQSPRQNVTQCLEAVKDNFAILNRAAGQRFWQVGQGFFSKDAIGKRDRQPAVELRDQTRTLRTQHGDGGDKEKEKNKE